MDPYYGQTFAKALHATKELAPDADAPAIVPAIVLRLEKDVFDKLNAAAARRGISRRKLVRKIITTIVHDGLFNAVLDDGVEP
jgi:predicted HicB family RNase H-like nuclease